MPAPWRHETGSGPWGAEGLEGYTDERRFSRLDGRGHLVLTAARTQFRDQYGSREYTSARLVTKGRFAVRYGRISARIEVPRGQGLWPAFWALGANKDAVEWPRSGEIDVMEVLGGKPHEAWGHIHGLGDEHDPRGGKHEEPVSNVGGNTIRGDLSTRLHTYSAEVLPGSVTFAVDGVPYFVAAPYDLRSGQTWPIGHPYYLLLNLAVGGTWAVPRTAARGSPAGSSSTASWSRAGRDGEGARPSVIISTDDRQAVAARELSLVLSKFDDAQPEPQQRRRFRLRRPRFGLLQRTLTGPLTFVMALGVLVQALTTVAGRSGWSDTTTDQLWWASLLLIVLPAAARLLGSSAGDGERMALAVLMPIALMLSRVAEYPTRYMWHDELAHANTLREILATGHLFGPNPLLPVSAAYPGLEVATAGVHQLSGLGQHTSAVVVLVVARIVQALAMLGIARTLTGSTRIAGIAALVYVCNPQYLYFNSQFAYQTVALPLVMAAVYLLLEQPQRRLKVVHVPVLAIAVACAAAVTHHLTTYLMIAALLAWQVLVILRRDVSVGMRGIFLTCLAAGLTSLWMALRPGNPVLVYLFQIAQSSTRDVIKRTQGEQTHELFNDFNGDPAPLWQQYTLTVSVVLTALLLLPALWRARPWARRRGGLAVLCCLIAMMYPLIPGGHLTFATSEVFDRASGFVYVALGCVFAVALTAWRRPEVWSAWRTTGLVALVAVLFVGGVILGSGPRWEPDPRRVPGRGTRERGRREPGRRRLARPRAAAGQPGAGRPDQPPARGQHRRAVRGDAARRRDQRLVGSAGADLHQARRRRHPGRPDRIRGGGPPAVRQPAAGRGLLREGRVGADRPGRVVGSALAKLDRVRQIGRIYDNGAIAVYDVRNLRDGELVSHALLAARALRSRRRRRRTGYRPCRSRPGLPPPASPRWWWRPTPGGVSGTPGAGCGPCSRPASACWWR